MCKKLLTVLLSLITILGCSKQVDPFEQIVRTQIQRYPRMQVRDLYKLVYQAAMGNIHLGVDSSVLRNYLMSEIEGIAASDSEPLVEEISPDGLIRVNLRPFKALGGNPEKLFEAMLRTADTFHPEKFRINEYWNKIGKMATDHTIPFDTSQLDSFFVMMQKEDFPAAHHSEEYSNAYNPAYRIISKKFLPVVN
jgi:hypothetical protein